MIEEQAMYPQDIDQESGCRLPLPRREELDDAAKRVYDTERAWADEFANWPSS